MRRYNTTGLFTLFLIGGYYVWRNRYEIQRFLESQGIKTPLNLRSIPDVVRSGVAKISGKTERGVKEVQQDMQKVG